MDHGRCEPHPYRLYCVDEYSTVFEFQWPFMMPQRVRTKSTAPRTSRTDPLRASNTGAEIQRPTLSVNPGRRVLNIMVTGEMGAHT